MTTTETRVKVTRHNKLVRDRIPEEIRARGASCEVTELSQKMFCLALGEKLVEEANEVEAQLRDQATHVWLAPEETDRAKLLEELADVQTVLDYLLYAHGFTSLELNDEVCRKMRDKGRFTNRRFLVESWEVPK